MANMLHSELTGQIIKAFYKVYNTLGYGFLEKEHKLQLINYLKATGKEVGLLLNFGKTPEFKRTIFTKD